MKQKQHIYQSLTIEVTMVLLASIISFPISDILDLQSGILPFVMVACYVVQSSSTFYVSLYRHT